MEKMPQSSTFISAIETKVLQQLSSQHVGYLVGAGASYLDGHGFPLTNELWNIIGPKIRNPERGEIKAKLEGGAEGIEQALDLLDNGAAVEKSHRQLVTEAIAAHFLTQKPSTEIHQLFLEKLAKRPETSIPIFCLNYDCLFEQAADAAKLRLVDGFTGIERPYFTPQLFQECIGSKHRGHKKPLAYWKNGIIHLYKLHGSLGWFNHKDTDIRLGFNYTTPVGAKRLMIPPQHRKGVDTTTPPYASLWSDFRGLLCNGPFMLNRLVGIGYGFRDEHVNSIIDNALGRSNFTLIILTRTMTDSAFLRWSKKQNVIVVTESRCSLNGTVGPGHHNLWKFETLAKAI
jgi:hypothetical protein